MQGDDTQEIRADRTQQLPRTIAVRQTRRVLVAILGTACIAVGIALIPVPGPWTIPPIFLGLTILSWEFRWAKRALFEMRRRWREILARRKWRRAKQQQNKRRAA